LHFLKRLLPIPPIIALVHCTVGHYESYVRKKYDPDT
jgi:hypothetical protein